MDIHGCVAIVTGGANGIGKALCHCLLTRGAKVTVADINETSGKETVSEFCKKFSQECAIFVKCDVTDDQNFRHAFSETMAKFGRLDIVCNNAGIGEENKWRQMIQVNFTGVVAGTELALEFMGKHKGGQGGVTINTASVAGLYPDSVVPVYSGTKAAVVMYTVCAAAAENYQRHGVRINAVCPTLVQTGLAQDIRETALNRETMEQYMQMTIMSPEEVAEATMELITDREKNGALLEIFDGKKSYFSLPDMPEPEPVK